MDTTTTELEGAELDAAVARCEGWTGATAELGPLFDYSTKWEHGGPIIERERIAIWPADDSWRALHPSDKDGYLERGIIDCGSFDGHGGPTPLIAAMRAYVASKA